MSQDEMMKTLYAIIEKQAEVNVATFDILLLICRQIRIDLPESAGQISELLQNLTDSSEVQKTNAFSDLSRRAILALSSEETWFHSLTFPDPSTGDQKPPSLTVLQGGLKDPE